MNFQVNSKFTESLRDAIEIAYEQGDEDLCTVRIGKHFFDSLFMLRAFESYCTRQVGGVPLVYSCAEIRYLAADLRGYFRWCTLCRFRLLLVKKHSSSVKKTDIMLAPLHVSAFYVIKLHLKQLVAAWSIYLVCCYTNANHTFCHNLPIMYSYTIKVIYIFRQQLNLKQQKLGGISGFCPSES